MRHITSPPPSRIYKKKSPEDFSSGLITKTADTYSPTISSTIGAGGLNFSVRNGKRWNPAA